MTHPNVARLRAGYEAFAAQDFAALDELFDSEITFHIGGRNPMAGDYHGRQNVYRFFADLMQATAGTFHLDVRKILADDTDGAVLLVTSGSRDGRDITFRDVHVYRMRDGRAAEFWDASTDQYANDDLLGGAPSETAHRR